MDTVNQVSDKQELDKYFWCMCAGWRVTTKKHIKTLDYVTYPLEIRMSGNSDNPASRQSSEVMVNKLYREGREGERKREGRRGGRKGEDRERGRGGEGEGGKEGKRREGEGERGRGRGREGWKKERGRGGEGEGGKEGREERRGEREGEGEKEERRGAGEGGEGDGEKGGMGGREREEGGRRKGGKKGERERREMEGKDKVYIESTNISDSIHTLYSNPLANTLFVMLRPVYFTILLTCYTVKPLQ